MAISLNGWAYNNDGTAAPNLVVQVYDQTPNLISSTTTGADGSWSFAGLTSGVTYDVKINNSGVIKWIKGGESHQVSSLNLTAPLTFSGLVTMTAGLNVTGTTTFNSGLAVTNADITVNSTYGFTTAVATDAIRLKPGGNIGLNVVGATSAANYIQIGNSASGAGVPILATGTDANVQMNLQAKGNAGFAFQSNAGANALFSISSVTNAVNYLQVQNAATSVYPIIASTGTDGAVGLTFNGRSANASGTYLLLYQPAEQLHTIGSYLTIQPATGTAPSTNVQLYTGGTATGISFRNGANTADNLLISDGGPLSFRSSATITGSADFIVQSGQGLNTAIGATDNIKLRLASTNGFVVQGVANAVNYIQTTNAVANNSPIIASTGSDANVNLNLQLRANSAAATALLLQAPGGATTSANYFTMQNAGTGGSPILAVTGSDATVNMGLGVRAGSASQAALYLSAPASTVSQLLINGAAAAGNVQLMVNGTATGISFRNNANNADNLLISDGGGVTVRNALAVLAGNINIGSGTQYQIAGNNVLDASGSTLRLNAGGGYSTGVSITNEAILQAVRVGNRVVSATPDSASVTTDCGLYITAASAVETLPSPSGGNAFFIKNLSGGTITVKSASGNIYAPSASSATAGSTGVTLANGLGVWFIASGADYMCSG